MNNNPRIKLNMNMQEIIISMVDGNPGATRVCCELVKPNPEWGFVDLCHLDDMEIYGSDIWLCYKDICKEDLKVLQKKIRDRSIKNELNELKKGTMINNEQ